jgi:hypothetical protein
MSKDKKKQDKEKKVYHIKSRRTLCHVGNKLAFGWRNVRVHGGGLCYGVRPMPGWLMIDLLGPTHAQFVKNDYEIMVQGFDSKYLGKWVKAKTITIPVKDGRAPTFPRRFWLDLVREIEEQAKQVETLNVLVFCLGGHGRTGTVLAILANLMLDEIDPIGFIRRNYCYNAIETYEQILYIQKITLLSQEHHYGTLEPRNNNTYQLAMQGLGSDGTLNYATSEEMIKEHLDWDTAILHCDWDCDSCPVSGECNAYGTMVACGFFD